jgi:hypothetical protein
MTRVKKLACATALLFPTVLGAGQLTPATARGFCNVDGLGSPQLQEQVRKAGATFFDGGSYLMAMLGAFERDETNEGSELGSKAVTFFGSAGDLYKSIRMEESVDKQLAEVNPKIAASTAKLPDTWQLFLDITNIVKNPNASANLFAFCSDRTLEMKDSTSEFLKTKQDPTKKSQEKYTAMLLNTLTRVLASGRAVSGFFAAAGGEN